MIPRDDARNTLEFDSYFIIQPVFDSWQERFNNRDGKPVPEGFKYSSDTNTLWLTVEELKEIL